MYKIRLSTYEDIPALRYVEAQAGERFREIGYDRIADYDPLDAQEHALAIEDGLSFLLEHEGEPIGFLVGEWVDECLHIAELSVHPNHAGKKLSALLISAAKGACMEAGKARLSLSTFRDVPWNAPYYEKLGFEVISAGQLGPTHAEMKRAQDVVFDTTARVFMVLNV